jgi:hypothetical protein
MLFADVKAAFRLRYTSCHTKAEMHLQVRKQLEAVGAVLKISCPARACLQKRHLDFGAAVAKEFEFPGF